MNTQVGARTMESCLFFAPLVLGMDFLRRTLYRFSENDPFGKKPSPQVARMAKSLSLRDPDYRRLSSEKSENVYESFHDVSAFVYFCAVSFASVFRFANPAAREFNFIVLVIYHWDIIYQRAIITLPSPPHARLLNDLN